MIFKRLDKFFHRFRRFIFKYKDGFYEVPYLANSPAVILESFKKTPFMNWDESRKLLSMKNHFLTANIYWIKLEDGLWFIMADSSYKVNLHYKFIYDKYLPANYYLLSFNVFTHTTNNKAAVINGLSYKSSSWNVIKPGAGASNTNFKNTSCSSIGIYFNTEWAKKNLESNPNFLNSQFQSFFHSKKSPIIIWPEKASTAAGFFEKARHILSGTDEGKRQKELGVLARQFSDYFTEHYDFDHSGNDVQEIKSESQLKLAKIEKLLNDNLFTEFPGIDALASKFGISPTKLKHDFKQVYGESIYQYCLGKQMDYAKILITEKHMKVSEVSYLLGYKSNSKFSEAFKNRHQVLPSKIGEQTAN
jgi:AraC-like DNA-binding protein